MLGELSSLHREPVSSTALSRFTECMMQELACVDASEEAEAGRLNLAVVNLRQSPEYFQLLSQASLHKPL